MKKIFLSSLALILILIFSVSATYAYLTDSAVAVNTFTVGQVGISLTEDTAARSIGSNILIPGLTYEKKPLITVDDESQPCWLFIRLENGLESIEVTGDGSIAAQLEENGWLPLENVENSGAYEDVYYYSTPVSAGETVKTFESFTISSDVTAAELAACDGATVRVTAYTVQAVGFDSAADAWAQAMQKP